MKSNVCATRVVAASPLARAPSPQPPALKPLPPVPPGYTVGIPFHVQHVPAIMLGSSLLVIVSLAAASILPAIRASRLQIAEALAHV